MLFNLKQCLLQNTRWCCADVLLCPLAHPGLSQVLTLGTIFMIFEAAKSIILNNSNLRRHIGTAVSVCHTNKVLGLISQSG